MGCVRLEGLGEFCSTLAGAWECGDGATHSALAQIARDAAC